MHAQTTLGHGLLQKKNIGPWSISTAHDSACISYGLLCSAQNDPVMFRVLKRIFIVLYTVRHQNIKKIHCMYCINLMQTYTSRT